MCGPKDFLSEAPVGEPGFDSALMHIMGILVLTKIPKPSEKGCQGNCD